MNYPIDVIVPVYRGLQDVLDCLDSIKASCNQTSYELIVIDDCSPDPQVSALLKKRAAMGEFTLLINNENLGFVATVNRGMRCHPERDVLLLNSDTLVANNWLDRLLYAAYKEDRIGTVTPFSNNATICSYPQFCEDNSLPSNTPLPLLDNIFARVNERDIVDIPTGVGFCMLIRRACLEEVGYFDVETFGKGYGEENDFCQRAIAQGWHNKFALDVFVQHTGNVSFGDEHNHLKHTALDKIKQRHPHYERDVHDHIVSNPAKDARIKAWLASLKLGTLPILVHVSHSRGGGTLRFVNELKDDLCKQYYSLLLCPSTRVPGSVALTLIKPNTHNWQPIETEFTMLFSGKNQESILIEELAQLPIAGFHYHHLLDLPSWIKDLAKNLAKPWLTSLHDYYYLSESISLTDKDDQFIGDNLAALENAWHEQFRAFLEGANVCIAPSNACKSLYANIFPSANIVTAYHEHGRHLELLKQSVNGIAISPEQAKLNIVVMGALSRIKGADLLEQAALACALNQYPIQFELIGYGYRNFDARTHSHLSVTGAYDEQSLLAMLNERKDQDKVDLIWFPAVWPETYSYTLSAALESQLPILAPNIGAFPERLHQRQHSWLFSWNSKAEDFVNLFNILVEQGSQAAILATLKSQQPHSEQPFQYSSDYSSLLNSNTVLTPDEHLDNNPEAITDWLKMALPRTKVTLTLEQNIRRKILRALYYMRSTPILSSVAKCLPQTFQKRVRERLSR